MSVTIRGTDLTLEEIDAVARGAPVRLSDEPDVLRRIEASRQAIQRKIAAGEQIYGVTTLFGGMADQYVEPERLVDVQKLALWQHKSTTGPLLTHADVRSAMLLRANSLMKGASGIRMEIIERIAAFCLSKIHKSLLRIRYIMLNLCRKCPAPLAKKRLKYAGSSKPR